MAIPPLQPELDQINADLKKLVDGDNSSVKGALQKYGLVVTAAGWQHVSQPALVAAGLDPGTDPARLQLFEHALTSLVAIEA